MSAKMLQQTGKPERQSWGFESRPARGAAGVSLGVPGGGRTQGALPSSPRPIEYICENTS